MSHARQVSRRAFLLKLGAVCAATPLVGSMLSACSTPSTPSPAAPAATTAPAASGVSAGSDQGVDLKALAEAAKGEGSVVMIGNTISFDETKQALADGFRATYGLPSSFKVEYLEKAIGEITKQVEEEIRASKLSIDVPFVNNTAWFKDLADRKQLAAFEAPSYQAYASLDSAPGFNYRPYYVSDYAITVNLVWNKEIVKDQFTSWWDLIKPAYRGKISVGSARLASTWAITYKAMRDAPDIGRKFFEELAKLQPATINRSEVQVDKAISGEYPIVLGGATRPYSFAKFKGIKSLGQAFPKEGVVPLQAACAVLSNAPHPNAARLMVEFLRSREGQQIMVDNEGRITTRTDVKRPESEYIPDIKDLKLLYIDPSTISADEYRTLGDDWVSIFGA